MRLFAKLFEVADTQVLFTVSPEEDDNPALKVTTMIQGAQVSMSMKFTDKDNDVAWEKAEQTLEAVTQARADEFHATMEAQLFGGPL